MSSREGKQAAKALPLAGTLYRSQLADIHSDMEFAFRARRAEIRDQRDWFQLIPLWCQWLSAKAKWKLLHWLSLSDARRERYLAHIVVFATVPVKE